MAVDLDGTLIRTDLLHEGFWGAVAYDPSVPLRASVVLVRQGRSGLKAWLARLAPVDPVHLPYTDSALAAVRRWRQRGGYAVLVTAADHRLAEAVAAHLGLFNEVHGTRPGHNLKGIAKARFLNARFGQHGFVYMGDSIADLQIWPSAVMAVTVGAGPRLRAQVESLGCPVEHLTAPRVGPAEIAGLVLRGGWLAGLTGLVALAMLTGMSSAALGLLALIWLGFGMVGTGAIVMHDLLHLKELRLGYGDCGPIAAGRIAMPTASAIALGLPLAGLGIGGLAGGPLALLCLTIAGAGGVLFGSGSYAFVRAAGLFGFFRAGLAGLAGLNAMGGI